MDVEQLIRDLEKPMYVWRMAHGMLSHDNVGQRKAAATRMARAEREIIGVVVRYCGVEHG